MEVITLDGMVEAALNRFPRLAYKDEGSRADAAAELVRTGQAHFLGNLQAGDWWEVGDHVCSIKGRICNCRDHSAPVHDDGRLCKHRLAAMFTTKLEWAGKQRIQTICQSATVDSAWLKVEVIYLNGGGRSYRLMGHRYEGGRWVDYPSAEWYPFTQKIFENAMIAAKWGIAESPTRQKNFVYIYMIARGAPAGFGLHSMAGEDARRIEQSKRFDEIRAMIQIQGELV